MLNSKERIWEIDFLRGLCIILMIFDHFWFILYKFNVVLWTDVSNSVVISLIDFANSWMIGKNSAFRGIGRYIVLFIFFIVSGISCTLSKNNNTRLIKIAFAAISISFFTIILSKLLNYDITILWGVFHCYSVCLFIYILLSKMERIHLIIPTALFLFIGFLLTYFNPTLDNCNILMPIGLPAKDFRYAIEYFPVLKWIGIYFIGVLIGKYLYEPKQSFFRLMYKIKIRPIAIIGKYGIYIYFIHFPILILCIYLIGLTS